MGGMFRSPPPAPMPDAVAASQDIKREQDAAAEKQRRAMAVAQGRSSMINPLTGGQGQTSQGEATRLF
jgi:hypothetical protein